MPARGRSGDRNGDVVSLVLQLSSRVLNTRKSCGTPVAGLVSRRPHISMLAITVCGCMPPMVLIPCGADT
jgi:hypothetical protein